VYEESTDQPPESPSPSEEEDQEKEAESAPAPLPEQPAPASSGEPAAPTARSSRKPDLDQPNVSATVLALYPALAEASPLARAKLLSEELHAGPSLPEGFGEPIELSRVLAEVPAADRRGVIAAYWRVAQKSAEYEALTCRSGFLEDLVPAALEQRHGPLGAEAMLELRAAELSAESDSLGAELALLDAQFDLVRQARRPVDRPWLLPATAPRCEPLLPDLSAQPRTLAESWPVRRWAAVIPALAEGLGDRAAAVVRADNARAAANAAYREGRESIVPVLDAIDRQAEQTLGFLAGLAEYNESIAAYTLAVMPPTVPAEQLARALLAN
jgi:hypothetical protein